MTSIALGTAPFAFQDVSIEESIRTIHTALDSGVRFIDTALAYNRVGETSFAEELVAAALVGRPETVTVATKGGHYRQGDTFPIDGTPQALRRDCEISLRALGVEQLDLYQLHHVDPEVPLAESVGALDELQREGKIASIGLSNVDIAQIELARGITEIRSVQNRLSLAHPEDLVTVAHCAISNILYLAYKPLEGINEASDAENSAVAEVAREVGVSRQRVGLSWLLAQSEAILPLVGSTRPESIADSAQASATLLDVDQLGRLSGWSSHS